MRWLDTTTKEEYLLGDWRGVIAQYGSAEAVDARMRIWRVDDPMPNLSSTVRYEGVTATEQSFSGRLLVGTATTWYFDDDGPGAPIGTVERWSAPGSEGEGLRFKRWDRTSTSTWRRMTGTTDRAPEL